MKSKDSFESIFLNNSEKRSEIKLSSLLVGPTSKDSEERRRSFFSSLVLEKSLLAYPFEILPHLGEN